MAGHSKPYPENRNPSSIRKLGGCHGQVYIMLCLRKTEQQIAGELGLSPEETCAAIDAVRHCLIREGLLGNIEDPEEVSIDAGGPDGASIPLASPILDLEMRLIIKEFIAALSECIGDLPTHQRTLLRLRFRNDLTAREIAEFIRKTGVTIIPGKIAGEITEQEIYSGINRTLAVLLGKMHVRFSGEYPMGMDHLKKILEEFNVMDANPPEGVHQ